jgi:hypothetical protein
MSGRTSQYRERSERGSFNYSGFQLRVQERGAFGVRRVLILLANSGPVRNGAGNVRQIYGA